VKLGDVGGIEHDDAPALIVRFADEPFCPLEVARPGKCLAALLVRFRTVAGIERKASAPIFWIPPRLR